MGQKSYFTEDLFKFLRELRVNNNREWFQANKERYESAVRNPALRFITDFGPYLKKVSQQFVVDPRPAGGSLFRIYRDIRFSRDKSPYKTHVGIHFRHRECHEGTHAPGFYLHLEPEGCFAGAGLWHPDAAALKRVRDAVINRPQAWKKAVGGKLQMEGEMLKRPPSGYASDHPLIEDLKHKDFIFSMPFSEPQVCGRQFISKYAEACKTMSPLVRFLTAALSLDW